MLIKDLKVTIKKEDVFRQIDCQETSNLYEEIVEEYREIEEEVFKLCEPVCLLEYSEFDGINGQENISHNKGSLMTLYSIGRKISEYSTKCFQEGDYLKGILSDAMANSALFSLEKEAEPYLRDICRKMEMGISCRLEAPHDIPMEMQKIVFEKVNAEKLCGMHISSGYMIDPVKSNVVIYHLTDAQELFQTEHDCRKCENYNCRYRHIPDSKLN